MESYAYDGLIAMNGIHSEELGYFLGVMKGDGSSYVTHDGEGNNRYCIQLQTNDKEFAQSFQKNLKHFDIHREIVRKNGSVNSKKVTYFIHYYSTKPYYLFELASKSISELNNLLLTEKSIREFIRGMYESEGNISTQNGRGSLLIACCGTDRELIDFVYTLLTRLGYSPAFKTYKQSRNAFGNKDIHQINLHVKDIIQFLEEITPVIKNPPRTNCKNCGKKSLKEFCSHSCATQYKGLQSRNGEYRTCEWCGVMVYRSPSSVHKYKNTFCCKQHYDEWQKAKEVS